MAATDAGIDHVADRVHGMAEDMARNEKSAAGVSNSFKAAAMTVIGFESIKSIITDIVKRSQTVQALNRAWSAEQLNHVNLVRQYKERMGEAQVIVRQAKLDGRARTEEENLKLDVIRKQFGELRNQRVLVAEINTLGKIGLGAMGAVLAAGTDLWLGQRRFNQDLIEANSSWEHRSVLLRETLLLQAQLGIGFEKATAAARALVHYGLDTETTFNANVRLVAQMEQGLGVSVSQSAQLASIVERQIKGSFESVAHVIAQIVNDTALAGDEAARLATNISTALGRLRPGLGAAGLPEVVRLVGRYEGALKEVGGQAGAFQQLLGSLTTPEGIVGAGALGVNPEFLATSQGVQNVMDRFAKYGEMLVGQSQGWERQFRLQMMGQIFNTTADNANQMLIAIQRANAQQSGQISLQDRWRQQLHATDQGVQRLISSLTGLLQGALYPFVFVVGAVANKVADFVEWLLKWREVAIGVTVGLSGVVLLLGVRMARLVGMMWTVVMSTNAVTAAMGRLAAAQAGASAGAAARAALGVSTPAEAFWRNLTTMTRATGPTAAAGSWFARWFPTISSGIATIGGTLARVATLLRTGFAVLTGPLGLLVTLTTIAVGIGLKHYLEMKRLNEQSAAQEKIIIAQRDLLNEKRRARIYHDVRSGDPMAAEKAFANLAQEANQMFVEQIADKAELAKAQKAWFEEQSEGVMADVLKAATTSGMFTTLTDRTPEQARREDRAAVLNEKLVKISEDTKVLMGKNVTKTEEEAQREEEERAKQRLLMYQSFQNQSLGRWR